LSSGSGGI